MTSAIQEFLSEAPAGTAQALRALAVAESLTDTVAEQLYALAPIQNVTSSLFIRALHYSGFIVPRNSEWHFGREVRDELQTLDTDTDDLVEAANRLLLARSAESSGQVNGSAVPRYLFTDAGRAYHKAELGLTDEALALYSHATEGPLTGAQWLAARLSREQETRGVLPPGRIEPMFVQAMVLFREGRRREAEPLFRRIAATDLVRLEVAISLHILGNFVGRRNPREAERFLRRSIELRHAMKDEEGLAFTLHSLGILLGHDSRRRSEAEAVLTEAIEVSRRIERPLVEAQVSHSLGNLIGRERRRRREAEDLLRNSLQIEEDHDNPHGQVQVLHSLGHLIALDPERRAEAEKIYLQGIALGEKFSETFSVAQVLHDLGNLIEQNPARRDEAEAIYRRSVKLGEQIGKTFHIAQTLHDLGNLVARNPSRREEAESILRTSLDMERLPNHQAQVLRSLAFVVEHRSPGDALTLLERSLRLNQMARNHRGTSIVKRSLEQLRARHRM